MFSFGDSSLLLSLGLTVSFETHLVSVLPGREVGSSLGTVRTMTGFAEPTTLASGTGKSTHFSVFVNGVDDPVDAWIVSDFRVVGIDQNHFVVFHGGVLVDPVRVQHAQIRVFPSHLFLRRTLQVAFELQVIDTLVLGFTVDHTTVILT